MSPESGTLGCFAAYSESEAYVRASLRGARAHVCWFATQTLEQKQTRTIRDLQLLIYISMHISRQ
jgi:hypothetical protein